MRTPRRARPKTMAGISSHFLSENQNVEAFQNRGIAIENLTVSYVRPKRGVKKCARLSSQCAGSRHIGHRLLSFGFSRQPLLVELVWSEVVERLVEAPGFVAVVPG